MNIESFEKRYIPVTESGCWLWLNQPMKNGYGVIYHAGRNVYAHRISWEIHRGPIPAELCVLHSCDVRICVNPDHLFLGTRTVNQQDMKMKNRSTQGSRNPMSKLTETHVQMIRSFTHLSTHHLAALFSVDDETIRTIRNGQRWTHVT